MIPSALVMGLALLVGSERVDLHLMESGELGGVRQAELEEGLASAIFTRAGRQVAIRSRLDAGAPGTERVVVRAMVGPRHVRLVAQRFRASNGAVEAELDLPASAPFDLERLAPLADQLFAGERAAPSVPIVAEGGVTQAPLWLAGLSAGLGAAAVGVAIASTRPVPELQGAGLIDAGTWAHAGSSFDARPVAIGLAIGAGVGCGLALLVAALSGSE
ncbi:MAG: hypothetical protein U1E65_35415 [Myxococcota bacterium]